MSVQKAKYYSPLVIRMDPSDYEGGYEENEIIDNRYALQYFDDIKDAIDLYNNRTLNEKGLMEYFDDNPNISAKVKSAFSSVEIIDGIMFGVTITEQTEPLTQTEQEQFLSYISGQNSDGFGEGFEQKPIKTDDGDIYVSLWHSGDDYYIKTKDELGEYLQSNNMQMGGM